MIWLDEFLLWVTDPNNVSEIIPSAVVLLCTIGLIITVSVSVRRASNRIVRAINGETPRSGQKSTRRDRRDRRDRVPQTTGPLRTGSVPVEPQSASSAQPLTPPPALGPTPASRSVAAPQLPSTPPPSAQAFARASALDNDPLNQ
jgi:hypothetical protein